MRVREMHPLCCISLESPGIGDRSPANSAVRVQYVTDLAPMSSGSDGRVAGTEGRSNVSVAGVLYKWTNYGKGWRSRWFLLRNGILSYSKIRRSDNLASAEEVRVIGNASRLDRCGSRRKQQKTVGVVHLKVSSFRVSKSDDRRFYIFTGTKTLHLRTDSRNDRVAWIEALVSARCLFPERPLNDDVSLMQKVISISTEKLRDRLLEEGLGEALVKDCEQIMLSEFSELKGQLQLLYEERLSLIDTLRQLEATSVEAEATEIHEGQFQLMKDEMSSPGHGKYSECSTTESSDDIEKQELEVLSDEDGNSFFDTKEYFSESKHHNGVVKNGKDMNFQPQNDFDNVEKMHVRMEVHDCKYPHIERRKKLPDPIEKEKGVSLWSMIKDNVGKDLTRVCLPVYFNEPISSLQKCFEDMEYSYLLDRAYEYGKVGNSLMRILNVAAFAVSGYASSEGRHCKPFNPLLGETYEADFPDMGIRFFSEKVSHHPMLIACHCEGRGWKFWGESNIKSKFWGRSIQLDPVGVLTLEFDDGEIFQWSKVQGFVEDTIGNKVATLIGKWDDSMYYINGDGSGRSKCADPLSDAELLWTRSKHPDNLTRYDLTSFAITLNELTSGLKEKLPPTDSRLRPDQRHLENGEFEKANAEKQRLERRQRMSRKLQERGWKPRWFQKDGEDGPYHYVGGYWEAREEKKWDGCPHIFDDFQGDSSHAEQ
ncbi:oxysterol-binding protein-related protein 2A-like isoform X2 [Aristolochia californica]|uniref:oxysterol-binding protein-related protein 2A-like isoform X2 n=1 Tax=Aristolochia californica TaxID=171875 RepID=UPI0035DC8A85